MVSRANRAQKNGSPWEAAAISTDKREGELLNPLAQEGSDLPSASPKISEKTRPEALQRRVGRILTFSGPIFATKAHEAAAQGVRVLV